MPAATASQRTRARRLPAVARPPRSPAVNGQAEVRDLELRVHGRRVPIGPSIEGDPQTAGTIDGTATVTIAIRDAGGRLEAMLDNDTLLDGAVTCDIAGTTYVIETAEGDGTGLLTVTLSDQAAWRWRQFSSFLKRPRGKTGLFGFAKVLVDEASGVPIHKGDRAIAYEPLRLYAPELYDTASISKAKASKTAAQARGTGASGGYTVKGEPATAVQRECIDGMLAECARDGCSRRVMIGTIMAVTQESVAGEEMQTTGDDDAGFLKQGRPWISLANARDPAKACRAFLLGDEAHVGGTGGVKGWKQRHGSLKTSRGDLNAEITAVQGSVGGYGQWEKEATRTVDRWRGQGGGEVTMTDPYEYTRGDPHGEAENSWDCVGRYATDLNIRRWAQDNTIFLVSADELRAGAPALELDGTEAFVLTPPAWQWTPNCTVNEVTFPVLAAAWGLRIGAVVRLVKSDLVEAAKTGIYIVSETSGGMVNPELQVTLRRPAPKRKEPAAATRQVSVTSRVGAAVSGAMREACRRIDAQKRSYPHPDVHHGNFKAFSTTTPLDCSESTCYALWLAGHYDKPAAITSGEFGPILEPGPGKEFTIYWNAGHVFTKFADGVEFNTGGHPAVSGPRLGAFEHTTAGFKVGHIRGH